MKKKNIFKSEGKFQSKTKFYRRKINFRFKKQKKKKKIFFSNEKIKFSTNEEKTNFEKDA